MPNLTAGGLIASGSATATTVPFEIQDQYQNLVTTGTDASAAVTISKAAGPGSLCYGPTTASCTAPGANATVNATSGKKTFSFSSSGLNFQTIGTTYQLGITKAATGGASGYSDIPNGVGQIGTLTDPNQFSVTNAPATQIVITGVNLSAAAGTSETPTVTVRDTFGNLAVDYNGLLTFTLSQTGTDAAQYSEITAPTIPPTKSFGSGGWGFTTGSGSL